MTDMSLVRVTLDVWIIDCEVDRLKGRGDLSRAVERKNGAAMRHGKNRLCDFPQTLLKNRDFALKT